ncbi:hypothetical protein [Nocardia farcinica]|uniref:hypothetical protein n=1 Tax=Nocardia farcinica TaxID=37329 RepID=UPI0024537B73|nr:hypothetical protein [Nocardia farcinica]
MSWADLHERTRIVHTVLARAAVDPDDPGIFDGLGDLNRLFGGPEGLLLALGHRWRNHLDVKIELGLVQGRSAAQMYRELCAEQPELRALLDAQYRRRNLDAVAPVPERVGARGR